MNRAFTLIEALVLVSVIAIIVVFAFVLPLSTNRGREGRRVSCQTNLKQIGLGLSQYTQDYNERFPPARVTTTTGWADVLQPYVKSRGIFQCELGPGGTTATFSTDYFYNRRLARFSLENINAAAWIVITGDGDDNAPTWNSWTGLPAAAATSPKSPSQRHLGGANYGFVDGHVKFLKPDQVSSTFAAPTSRPTFAVR